MSNAERQRQFRERNPGYYQRLRAKERARVKADLEMAAREKAIAKIIALPMPPPERCLPAPEQVTPSWADRLMAEIQSATAARQVNLLEAARELREHECPGDGLQAERARQGQLSATR